MDTDRLLIEAIKDNPRERTAKLVYADWLEENGQPDRAELIRLSAGDAGETGSGRLAREGRIKQLEHNCRRKLKDYCIGVEYCDGLPFLIVLVGNFLREAECIVAARPDIVGVDIVNDVAWSSECGRQVVRSPLLINFNRLSFSGWYLLTDTDVAALARNPATARLTHLSLMSTELSDAGATALADSPHLRRLTSLAVCSNGLTARGWANLFSASDHETVEHLSLYGAGLNAEALRLLGDGPALPNFKSLTLGACALSRAGLSSLADCRRLPGSATLTVDVAREAQFVGTLDELRDNLAAGRRVGNPPGPHR